VGARARLRTPRRPTPSAWTGTSRRRKRAPDWVIRSVALQGNLDPCTLYAPINEIRAPHARHDRSVRSHVGHVANLGHGILPDMKPAHAKAFMHAVQGMAVDRSQSAHAATHEASAARSVRLMTTSVSPIPSACRRDVATRRCVTLDRGAARRTHLVLRTARSGRHLLEDRWERPGGGGGVARVMTDGVTFEKAGINRSAVMGTLPEAAARRLGGAGAAEGSTTSSPPA
jgi:hypothetical protein